MLSSEVMESITRDHSDQLLDFVNTIHKYTDILLVPNEHVAYLLETLSINQSINQSITTLIQVEKLQRDET